MLSENIIMMTMIFLYLLNIKTLIPIRLSLFTACINKINTNIKSKSIISIDAHTYKNAQVLVLIVVLVLVVALVLVLVVVLALVLIQFWL